MLRKVIPHFEIVVCYVLLFLTVATRIQLAEGLRYDLQSLSGHRLGGGCYAPPVERGRARC